MKIVKAIGILLIFSMLCVGIGYAENANGTEITPESIWNGTWSSPDYTVYITQDHSGIKGVYVPADLDSLDPGRLEGNVSPDGKTYSGVWVESGSNTYTLSSDKMSFSISGYADPQGPMTEPAYYTGNATRIGGIADPANPWTGNYASTKKSYNLTQDGISLTGMNMPLTNVNDETGILNGTVSADGITYNGTWIEKGGFVFAIADDGSFINATVTRGLEPNAFVEHMTFSR